MTKKTENRRLYEKKDLAKFKFYEVFKKQAGITPLRPGTLASFRTWGIIGSR